MRNLKIKMQQVNTQKNTYEDWHREEENLNRPVTINALTLQ